MRSILFAGFIGVVFFIFFDPIRELFELSRHSDLYSHFPLIPVVSLFLIFLDRKKIFSELAYSYRPGIALVVTGVMLYVFGKNNISLLDQNDFLAMTMVGLICCILGGFALLYGKTAFRKALFPLLFLVFMVPIPTAIREAVTVFLQVWSAEASYRIFKLVGVPVFRDGFLFELPGVAVEVAKQCSGIRSTLALVITSVMAGHLFLRSGISKTVLVLAIFPISIFKNAVRIVTLSLLAVYVDKAWLTDSWLHHGGGIVFLVLALFMLLPVLLGLKKVEGGKGFNVQRSTFKVDGEKADGGR